MRLDAFFMLADHIQVGEESKLTIVGGGISQIRAPELPTVVPALASLARLMIEEGDPEAPDEFRLSVRWTRPDGTEMGESPPLVLAPRALSERGGAEIQKEQGIYYVVQMNGIRFDQVGSHRLALLVNGEPAAERWIEIVEEAGGNKGATRPVENDRDSASGESPEKAG